MDQRSGDGVAWGPRGEDTTARGEMYHQGGPEYIHSDQQVAAQAEAERLYAEQIAGQQAWEAQFADVPPAEGSGLRARGARLANIAGAVMSLALIAGLAVWGYRITVRDVSGVPVVVALDGPMRMAPDEPGGEVADHTGLAVNQVAADGEGPGMSEQITLAPGPVRLTEEDLPLAAMALDETALEEEITTGAAEADDGELLAPDMEVAVSLPDEVDPNDPVAVALAMAGQVAAGATPLESRTADASDASDVAAEVAAEVAAKSAAGPLAALPGVKLSPRPARRPARVASAARAAAVARDVEAPASAAPEAGPGAAVAASGAVAPGTRLVQLGAFETPGEAAALWGQLNGRFDSLMVEKTRLIMEAESGGKTFYRLRAQGFADLSDARRFCAALVAERAECIPVVAR